MSDINSIRNVNQVWPLKPVQPSRKDREAEHGNTRQSESEDSVAGEDDESTIDEYV